MKVHELIERLKECNPESEVNVLVPLPNRPIGGRIEPVFDIIPSIHQDTNKVIYLIDTGIGEEGRYHAHRKKGGGC